MKKIKFLLWQFFVLLIVLTCQLQNPAAVQAASDPRLQELLQKTQQTIAAGKMNEALKVTREAVEHARKLDNVEPVAFSYVLNNLAYVLSQLKKDPEQSEKLWHEALAVLEKTKQTVHHAGLIAAINLANHEAAHGKLKAAEARIDKMARSVSGIALEGNALHSAAIFYYANGRIKKASKQFIDVLKRFPAVIKSTYGTLYTTLSKASDEAYEKGNLDDALAITDVRIQILHTYVPDSQPAVRNLLFDSHFKSYQAEDYAKAAGFLEDWTREGTPTEVEKQSIEDIFDSLVTVAQLVGIVQPNARITLDHAQLALAYAKALGSENTSRLGLAWRAMGHAQESAEQMQSARDSLLRALSAFEKGKDGIQHRHLILSDLGRVAYLAGNAKLAEQYYSRADISYADALKAGVKPLSNTDLAISLSNRAQIDLQTKQPQKALAKLKDAMHLHLKARETSPFKWNNEIITADILFAQAHGNMELGNHEDAVRDLKKAAEIAQEHFPRNHPEKARMLANIADSMLTLQEEALGKDLLQTAVRINAVTLTANAPQLIETEFKLALLHLRDGKSDEARHLLQRVTEARKSPAYRNKLAGASFEYEIHAWNELRRKGAAGIETAFETLQWTQMASAAQALSGAESRLAVSNAGIAQLIRKKQNLVSNYQRSTNRLVIEISNENPAAEKLGLFRSRLDDIENELKSVDKELAGTGLDTLGIANITPISLKDMQAMLREDEVLVTFLLPGIKQDAFTGSSGSSNRVIAVTRNAVMVGDIAEKSRSRLLEKIVTFRCAMAVADKGCANISTIATRGSFSLTPTKKQPKKHSFPTALANELYEDLFSGVEELIGNKPNLIIAPPADLLSLPFQALVTGGPEATSLRKTNWLIRRHAISVIPSITSLRGLRVASALRKPAQLPFLGIGDPIIGNKNLKDINCGEVQTASLRATPGNFSLHDNKFGKSGYPIADVQKVASLPRLQDTACELQSVRDTIGGNGATILLRNEATEENIKSLSEQDKLANYRVISFATHGLIAGEAGSTEPGLVLTPPQKGSERDDGLLTASEIAAMRLNADLIVLSACNTAAGSNTSAEGLSGLARAFFHAGARSILVTHWSVYSEAAVTISTGMFSKLKGDVRTPQALRQSILSLLDNPASSDFQLHPSYWAPFAIVGDS